MDEKDARQRGEQTDHALAKAFATSGPILRPAEVAMSDEDVVPSLITQRGGQG